MQATKYHESGEDGSFENIDIERKKFGYEEEYLENAENEGQSYHHFTPDYFGIYQ